MILDNHKNGCVWKTLFANPCSHIWKCFRPKHHISLYKLYIAWMTIVMEERMCTIWSWCLLLACMIGITYFLFLLKVHSSHTNIGLKYLTTFWWMWKSNMYIAIAVGFSLPTLIALPFNARDKEDLLRSMVGQFYC